MHLPRLRPILALAAIGLGALCGCQPVPTVKVGFIGSLSGRVSELAIDGRNGTQLAIETLNAQSGPHYELHLHDDAAEGGTPAAIVDAMAAEGDAFAIGPMTSVLAKAMVPEADKHQLVLISPTANSDDLSGMDDWFFRVIPPAGPGAMQIADAAVGRGLMTASVMAEWHNRAYSERFTEVFAGRFRSQGGTVANVVRYESDQHPDYTKIAGELLSSHPRLVLLVCGSVDASIIAQQLRRLDPDVQIAMASWAANVQLLQMGGRAIEGALVLQALDLDSPEPAYVAFRKRYVERFGNAPSQAAVFSYDATMLGAEALRRRTGGQTLRDALRAPANWPGLQQPIVLDHFGDSVSRFRLSEVRQGHFVMVGS